MYSQTESQTVGLLTQADLGLSTLSHSTTSSRGRLAGADYFAISRATRARSEPAGSRGLHSGVVSSMMVTPAAPAGSDAQEPRRCSDDGLVHTA